MRYFLLIVAAVFSLSSNAQDYVPNQLLVQFEPQIVPEVWAEQSHDLVGQELQVVKTISRRMHIYLLEATNPMDAESMAKVVSELEGVQIAQVNHTNLAVRALPNDPNYTTQWSLSSGAPGRIYAPEAWDIATGGTTPYGDEIVVAVIDGGMDLNHTDLNYFINTEEIAFNGIDDDNNGYIDDYRGWDAYDSDGSVPSDQHGTHVGGIIGAKGNNATGVVGVNWDVKVMPIAGSSTQENTVLEAYGYALEMRALYEETNGEKGAYVVATNSSFGVNYGNPANYPLWCAFFDSLGAYGILSAGATANLGIDVDAFNDIPTACPSDFLISVTNTMVNGEKNSGAAYGATTIDLGAPGTSIQSTIQANSYGALTGTSMATPHVAGAIALMHNAVCTNVYDSYAGKEDSLALWFKEVLLATVENTNSLSNTTVSGGRMNLHRALDSLTNFNCIRGQQLTVVDSCGDCNAQGTMLLTEGRAPFSFAWSTGSVDSVLTNCAGGYTLTVTDDLGFSATYNFQLTAIVSIAATTTISQPTGVADGSISANALGGNGAPYSYVWSTGDTGSLLSNVPAGTYMLTVTDARGCSNTFVYGLFNTGVGEMPQSDVVVYPNPADEVLNMQFTANESVEVALFDASGRIVLAHQGNAKDVRLDVSDLNPGLYLMRVRFDSGATELTKVTVR
jgi:subtilisin family serine protease